MYDAIALPAYENEFITHLSMFVAESRGESRESHINTQQTLLVNNMRTIAVCMYVGMYMSI